MLFRSFFSSELLLLILLKRLDSSKVLNLVIILAKINPHNSSLLT